MAARSKDGALLLRVLDECVGRVVGSRPSPMAEELGSRADRLVRAVRSWGHARPGQQDAIALGEEVLKLAEEVLGRVDPAAEAMRKWLADQISDAAGPSIMAAGAVVDGRYLVLAELGRGGMGLVYHARDLGLDRQVALKLLFEDGDVEAALRFRREATALAAIRNDHVVQVYAFGTYARGSYLAMERVEGSSLEELIASHARAGEPIPASRAVTIIRQIAQGLEAVHAAGFVHCDVKPSNVVVEERSGRPVLIDFGLALRGAEPRRNEPPAGTPHYMAPEQMSEGGIITPRADVYALGCLAYELLCGRTVFEGASLVTLLRKHVLEAPLAPSRVRPGLLDFDGPLLRALSKRPGDRQPSVTQLAVEIEAAYRSFASPGPTQPPPSGLAPDVVPQPVDDRIRVLVVDDDDVIRQISTRCARAAFGPNVEILAVSTGQEALAAAEAKMPDLVLLDYAMPELDGVMTLSRLRSLPRGTRARVVVISAAADQLPRWRFALLGVSDFVDKPVRISPFVALLREVGSDAGWTIPAPP